MRNILLLLIACAIGTLPGWAQSNPENTKRLQEVREELQASFSQRFSQLMLPAANLKLKAHARNIPMKLNLAGGETADLMYFDDFDLPVYYKVMNVNAAKTTGTNALQPGGDLGLDLTGKGMVAGIYDQTRPKADHAEYNGRVTQVDGSTETISSHATHVTGTILASGVTANAKGMASEATGWAFNWEADLDKLNNNAYDPVSKPGGHLVSNHSYGIVLGWYRNSSNAWAWAGNSSVDEDEDYRFGFYTTKSKGLDDLLFAKPYYTVVWAAGNDRSDSGDGSRDPDGPDDTIGPEGVAKNVITVGAVSNVGNYTGPSDVKMSDFSSWGPTDDGRVKPDLVGMGVNVYSSSVTNSGATDSYASLSGTSMASPNVTGSLLLLQQLFQQRNAGRYMWSSTVKALAIHTAKEAGTALGPDYVFGWGLLDAKKAAEVILDENGNSTIIRELNLANGSAEEIELLSDGITPLRVTIAWTDPSGNPVGASLDPDDLMLVNDLDLRILDEQGKSYFPYTLDPSKGPNAQAVQTQDNFRDNVEQVYVPSPTSQKYTIRIYHKGDLVNSSQDFSLIVTAGTLDGASETLYWIGGNGGDWSDPSNWSATSGGASAGKIPGADTRVVVDEGKGGNQAINLTSGASAFSVNIFGSQNTSLNLSGNSLQVSNGFRVSNPTTQISGGTLAFENSSANSLYVEFGQTEFDQVITSFNTGQWELISADELGDLVVQSAQLSLNPLEVSAQSLEIVGNGTVDGQFLQLNLKEEFGLGNQSSIKEGINLVFEGNTGEFSNLSSSTIENVTVSSGTLDILSGGLSGLVIENASLTLGIASLTLDDLTVGPDAELDLGASGDLVILEGIVATATSASPARITAGTKGSLTHDVYVKYCFDHISINNVDKEGESIINLGSGASVTNATGWLTQACDDVLFANFSTTFPCAGAAVTFENLSEGAVAAYSWDFDGLGTSTLENPIFTFDSPGTYEVQLTVSNSNGSTSYAQEVVIGTNSLQQPVIVVNGSTLTSQQPGDSYQWYLNGAVIPGATSRSYVANNDGIYQVAIVGESCNRVSEPVVISAIPDQEVELGRFGIFVGPIPSKDHITVTIQNEYAGPIELSIIDLAGRTYQVQELGKNTDKIEVQMNLPGPQGLYLLRIKTNNLTLHKKVLKY